MKLWVSECNLYPKETPNACICIQYVSANEIGWSSDWLAGWCIGKHFCANYPMVSDRLQSKFVCLNAMKCRCTGHTVFLDTVKATKIMCPWTNTCVVGVT